MNTKDAGFYHLGLSPDMLEVLDRLKFYTPTPIQHQAIPIALEGKDIMGVAQTGTGKTMAFGIPTIQRLAAEGGQALPSTLTDVLKTRPSSLEIRLRGQESRPLLPLSGFPNVASVARRRPSAER